MLTYNFSNIVGNATKNVWSQAQTVNYDQENKLIILLSIKYINNDSLLDLSQIGSEILSQIELKAGEIETQSSLVELVDQTKTNISQEVSIELLLVKIIGKRMIVSGDNTFEIYLARDKKLAKLDSNIEGELKIYDRVVILTPTFLQVITLEKLREAMIDVANPSETLSVVMHTKDDTSDMCACVMIVDQEKPVSFWPKVKLENMTSEPKKINLIVGVTILTLLIIMIGIGMVKKTKLGYEREFENLKQSVESKLSQVMTDSEHTPTSAKTLLNSTEEEIKAYIAKVGRDEYKTKANLLLDKIKTTEEQAFKKNEVKLTTLIELNILVDGLNSSVMKSDGKGNLLFLDNINKKIVQMNIADRSRQIINTEETVKDIAVFDTKLFALSSDKVNEYSFKKDNVSTAIEADEYWREPEKIEIFSGNIYIFDKGQSEIWKYPTLGDTYGGRRRWLASGITPDLTNVVSMRVIGDIWLLTSTGKLQRYNRGAPVNFNMEGFPAKDDSKALITPSSVFANENNIYVLENGGNRIVVFGTDGKYQAQYNNSEFVKASDLVVIDDKVYVLIENVVKEFSL